MATSLKRVLSYVKRNSNYAQGTDSTFDATVTAPWLSGVSLYLKWSAAEAVRGTFNWGSCVASALEAKQNGRRLILRMSCGNDAPSHIYSSGGVLNCALEGGTYSQPAVWTTAWQNEYIRLYTAIKALLATPLTDGSGEVVSKYVNAITIGSACQNNPEMGSVEEWKLGVNAPAIKTALDGSVAALDGLSGKGPKATYSDRLIQLLNYAWDWGINWHLANITECASIFVFGNLIATNDNGVGQNNDGGVNEWAFAQNATYFGGANKGRIIGAITSYGANQTAPGSTIVATPHPYEQDRKSINAEAQSIEYLRAIGGAYAFQFDASAVNAMTNPTPANDLALMLHDGATLSDGHAYAGNIPSYYSDVSYIECSQSLFGVNDQAMKNTIAALAASLPPDVPLIPVHGQWEKADGSPETGTVTFTALTPRLVDPTYGTVITPGPLSATLDSNGEIRVNLPATDFHGGTFQYLVAVQLSTSSYSFKVSAPSTSALIELSTFTPTT